MTRQDDLTPHQQALRVVSNPLAIAGAAVGLISTLRCVGFAMDGQMSWWFVAALFAGLLFLVAYGLRAYWTVRDYLEQEEEGK